MLFRSARYPLRILLGRLADESPAITLYLRGLFVPGGEFYSRAPEYPPQPGAGQTVHKWPNISEVNAAPDARAAADVVQLLVAAGSSAAMTLRSEDVNRKGWSEDAIAIGSHPMAIQILETCEPRLVAFRNPDAFRSLGTREVFESKGAADFGLIYKGRHPSSHREFWVVMGLNDSGTEAAARFLKDHGRSLGRLLGATPFGAIVAVSSSSGREGVVLRSLQPRPAWWRRQLFRREWKSLAGSSLALPR